MDRRTVLALASTALAAPRLLFAQPAKRVYRIAILDDASEGTRDIDWTTLRRRLGEQGIVEGKNAAYVFRHARGTGDRLNALAAELAATEPDILVTPSTPSTRAAIRATASIPIVFIGAGDPAGSGLVASLSRPGSNVTGVSILEPDLCRLAGMYGLVSCSLLSNDDTGGLHILGILLHAADGA